VPDVGAMAWNNEDEQAGEWSRAATVQPICRLLVRGLHRSELRGGCEARSH